MSKSSNYHVNSKHSNGYDFATLCKVFPDLRQYVFVNKYDTETINFSNPKAVKVLNTALLFAYYKVKYWSFPDENLCPPIPSRAEYIHHLADLLDTSSIKRNIKVLDVGTGASCIYPLLGKGAYNWNFIATDIDKKSLFNANKIINRNKLTQSIQTKHQKNKTHIFKGILSDDLKFSATMCNPPFYASLQEARQQNMRKNKNLGTKTNERNFAGNQNELCYKGGEKAFLHTYLYESSLFKQQCFWYTTLVSKKENVKSMYTSLQKLGATAIKTIQIQLGNKITRIVAWTFLTKEAQKEWVK